MCLLAEKGIKVADHDMLVYKAVSVPKSMKRWYPLFFGKRTGRGFGKTHSLPGKDEGTMTALHTSWKHYVVVEGGFFHSTCVRNYAERIARDAVDSLRKTPKREMEIFVCNAVIPAGTRYYTDGADYASEKIIVKKPCK